MTGDDGGWKARRGALSEHADDGFGHGDLPELVALLDHETSAVRAGAVWRIAELADEDPRSVGRFVADVASCISDADAWVRRGATWAIQEIAESRPTVARTAMAELIDALDDDDPLVVENAIVGVGTIASDYPGTAARARIELRRIARQTDDPRLRRYARSALERIPDRTGDPAIEGEPVGVYPFLEYVDGTPSGDVPGSAGEETDTAGNAGEDSEASEVLDRSRPGRYSPRPPVRGSVPPDSIPEPSGEAIALADIDTKARIRSGPLLEVYRARADPGGEPIPLEFRTLRGEVRERDDAVDIAEAVRDAMADWRLIAGHDTVATVLDRGETPPWIATELVDSRAFEAYAAGTGFDEALYYASCLVRAVAHGHGHDVIHGGLSSETVGFVEPIEDAWHVPKVTDWGIVPIVVDRLDRASVPLPYAAPEQIAPAVFGRPDQATDVYGLGALLYALFAGHPPLGDAAKPMAERIRRVESNESLPADLPEPDPPSESDDAVPEAADTLVDRALARDRMQRYETVTDLQRDLDALIETHANWR